MNLAPRNDGPLHNYARNVLADIRMRCMSFLLALVSIIAVLDGCQAFRARRSKDAHNQPLHSNSYEYRHTSSEKSYVPHNQPLTATYGLEGEPIQ